MMAGKVEQCCPPDAERLPLPSSPTCTAATLRLQGAGRFAPLSLCRPTPSLTANQPLAGADWPQACFQDRSGPPPARHAGHGRRAALLSTQRLQGVPAVPGAAVSTNLQRQEWVAASAYRVPVQLPSKVGPTAHCSTAAPHPLPAPCCLHMCRCSAWQHWTQPASFWAGWCPPTLHCGAITTQPGTAGSSSSSAGSGRGCSVAWRLHRPVSYQLLLRLMGQAAATAIWRRQRGTIPLVVAGCWGCPVQMLWWHGYWKTFSCAMRC